MKPALRGSGSVIVTALMAAAAACSSADSPPQTARTAVERYLSAYAAADTDAMRTLQCAHPLAKSADDDFARTLPDQIRQWQDEAWWPPDWGVTGERSLTGTVHEVEWWLAADEQSRESAYFFVFQESDSWRICAFSDTAASDEFRQWLLDHYEAP